MITSYVSQFQQVVTGTVISDRNGQTLSHEDGIRRCVDVLQTAKQHQRMVFLTGNGGSNAIVSHVAIDLINACKMKAYPLTDASTITCMANDYGYPNVFSGPMEQLFSQDDVLIAVSSSGKSPNIIRATETARNKGGKVISFSGFGADNPLRTSGDLNFWLDNNDYGKVEIGHALLLHIITDMLNMSKK